MNSTGSSYCDLKQFSKDFRGCHIYLSFIICGIGSILNILNIFVLSTRQMRSPTNYILASLAVADVLVMIEYIPFAYLQDKSTAYFTHGFAAFLIFHAAFTNVFHFISCCLAIILAVWRFIAVKFPQNNQKWCGDSRTKYTIIMTYVLCMFVCVPLVLSMKIKSMEAFMTPSGQLVFNNIDRDDLNNITIYYTDYKQSVFKDISFYLYGVVLKLIPCILLSILSTLLILELVKAKQRKKALMNHGKDKENQPMKKKKINQKRADKEKQFNRTTKMLCFVLLLFLMAEFPQAIMGLLHHILGDKFYKECYVPAGDLLDIFTLTISAINFVLYCIMSQKFREVFSEIFFPYLPCRKTVQKQWISLQTVNTLV